MAGAAGFEPATYGFGERTEHHISCVLSVLNTKSVRSVRCVSTVCGLIADSFADKTPVVGADDRLTRFGTKTEHLVMKKWPHTIPHDLKCKLESLREYRSKPSLQDDWAAIFEWLNAHNVQPPDHALPTEPELKGPVGHW
ncbi:MULTISPECIES: hypothetical protein [unclassified Ruegeria]|uniref:hypothetical protein n=1 Tax=unclassified Ruegeria TaxID=2625375 RepID=UPI001488C58D|nr:MULTISPECIES: hypothetical protein [unclassified Ruegeria]NOD62133.1 hypothetical protein [Ruegeria sp. HKCCD6109]